ncbi:ion channel [Fictibacillus iocasae]|uniref:Ion channel n=1 Tax=Fictibacillus iocasae TaxID=2715437 RepID=A0ABW2NPD1_9BACL
MGQAVLFLIGCLALYIIYSSIAMLFTHHGLKEHLMPVSYVAILVIIYVTVIVGFGLMFTIAGLLGINVLEGGTGFEQDSLWIVLTETIYFSASTLFSLGYGDILPVGFGRVIAITEAMIGYILPIAFVLTSVIQHNTSSD